MSYIKRLISLLLVFTILGLTPIYAENSYIEDMVTEAPAELTIQAPTQVPTEVPIQAPTQVPTEVPTQAPTQVPTEVPTQAPTQVPTQAPTEAPTQVPTQVPTEVPTEAPTQAPTEVPTEVPTQVQTEAPTEAPIQVPIQVPTQAPTNTPPPMPTEMVTKEIPLELMATLEQSNIVPGESFRVSVESKGGVGTHLYAYYVYKDGSVVKKQTYSVYRSFIYKPTSVGTYKVLAFVKDGAGNVKSVYTNECGVAIEELEGFFDGVLDGESGLGEAINLSITARGGKAPYTYAYYVYRNGSVVKRQGYTANNKFTYTPTILGEYYFITFVKDASGKIVSDKSNKTNVKTYIPLNCDYSYTPEVFLGDNISFTLYTNGGSKPYKYAYYIYIGTMQ